ncbi:hypothetical protein BDAP_001317 [Binucleata daphniae]
MVKMNEKRKMKKNDDRKEKKNVETNDVEKENNTTDINFDTLYSSNYNISLIANKNTESKIDDENKQNKKICIKQNKETSNNIQYSDVNEMKDNTEAEHTADPMINNNDYCSNIYETHDKVSSDAKLYINNSSNIYETEHNDATLIVKNEKIQSNYNSNMYETEHNDATPINYNAKLQTNYNSNIYETEHEYHNTTSVINNNTKLHGNADHYNSNIYETENKNNTTVINNNAKVQANYSSNIYETEHKNSINELVSTEIQTKEHINTSESENTGNDIQTQDNASNIYEIQDNSKIYDITYNTNIETIAPSDVMNYSSNITVNNKTTNNSTNYYELLQSFTLKNAYNKFTNLKVTFGEFIAGLPVLSQKNIKKLFVISYKIETQEFINLTNEKDRNTRYLSTLCCLNKIKTLCLQSKVVDKTDKIMYIFNYLYPLRTKDVFANIRSALCEYLVEFIIISDLFDKHFDYFTKFIKDKKDSVRKKAIKGCIKMIQFAVKDNTKEQNKNDDINNGNMEDDIIKQGNVEKNTNVTMTMNDKQKKIYNLLNHLFTRNKKYLLNMLENDKGLHDAMQDLLTLIYKYFPNFSNNQGGLGSQPPSGDSWATLD